MIFFFFLLSHSTQNDRAQKNHNWVIKCFEFRAHENILCFCRVQTLCLHHQGHNSGEFQQTPLQGSELSSPRGQDFMGKYSHEVYGCILGVNIAMKAASGWSLWLSSCGLCYSWFTPEFTPAFSSVEAAAQSHQAVMATPAGKFSFLRQEMLESRPIQGGITNSKGWWWNSNPREEGVWDAAVRKSSDPGWEQPQQVENVQ